MEHRPTRGSPDAFELRTELMLLVSALVVLGVSALSVRDGYVSGFERAVFRRINDLPDLIYRPVSLVMELGNVAAVGVAALVAVAFRRYRLALGMALAGFGAYFAAKVVKSWVDRGRPADLFADVDQRGAHAGGLGYVSGHAAVAFALVTVVTMWLSPRGRTIAWIAAGVVAFARIYVGAHLPMDVVGGAALGIACGSLARMVVGARGHGRQRAAPGRGPHPPHPSRFGAWIGRQGDRSTRRNGSGGVAVPGQPGSASTASIARTA